MDHWFKAIGIIVAVGLLATAHGSTQQAQFPVSGQDPGSRALFLEHYLIANGSVVRGQVPFKSVNFPTYWFNENTRQLNGKVDFPVNDSLKVIVGDVLMLKGNFGAGTGNKLFGAYSLPVRADEAVIYSVDTSGNVIMNVNKETFVLKPGKTYTYTENETLREANATIDVRYNHTYVNHGFIDKKSIIGQ